MIKYYAQRDWPYHISAGGVVVKENDNGQRQFALLYRSPMKRGGDMAAAYHLPKGTLEIDETLEECAKREILEETGFNVELEVYLGSLYRKFNNPHTHFDWDRTVHYYLGIYRNGDKTNMDHEHDDLVWVDADEAMKKLAQSPKKEEEIIARAEEYFQKVEDGTLSQ